MTDPDPTPRPTLTRPLLLAGLALGLVLGAVRAQDGGGAGTNGGGAAAAPAKPATERPLLARVAVIGASVSAGFGNGLKLAKAMDPGIGGEHEPVADYSTPNFFLGPQRYGKECLDKAIAHEPTLIVGIDYLFWYGYGRFFAPVRSDAGADARSAEEQEAKVVEMRLALLEKGLAQLDRWEGPLVVGDFPDMSGADPRMLSKAMIPTEAALAKLNARVAAWVAARREKGRRTLLVSLADMVKDMRGGKLGLPASPDGKHAALELDAGTAMLWDRLHPSKIGVVALVDRVWADVAKGFGKAVAGLDYEPWTQLEEMGFAGTLERKRGMGREEGGEPASRPAGGGR
ncbi:MAG: hypothetical protein R3F30_13720 [Planctomycetota bacterium]